MTSHRTEPIFGYPLEQGLHPIYDIMHIKPYELDHLDISFDWGEYEVKLLKCHLAIFQADAVIDYHQHSEYEFHFIPEGKGRLFLKGESYSLHQGLFYLTGPGVVHKQYSDLHEPMKEFCLHIDIRKKGDLQKRGSIVEQQEAAQCVKLLEEMPPIPQIDQYDGMRFFLLAYQALHENQLGLITTIQQAIIQIIFHALRAHSPGSQENHLPYRNINNYRAGLVTQYIQANYTKSITLAEVAKEVHLSERQLQRLFQEELKTTFSLYIKNYRLHQVCHDLIHTNLSIEQLALKHGFANSSYLHQVFKKRYNQTPTQYKIEKTYS